METSEKVTGRFISFEGIDGCGKSTLLQVFSQWLTHAGVAHIATREPGGTHLGESIRELLLDPMHKGMSQATEVLLYSASRAQLIHEVIRPALNDGVWVLADRFSDATLAYQGFGRGLDLEKLRDLQEWATQGIMPHHTILLDCTLEVAASRLQAKNNAPDRIESERQSFHRRVREGYLELARQTPQRFIVLDANLPLEQVVQLMSLSFWEPVRQTLAL
jgi:dTMP kinase